MSPNATRPDDADSVQILTFVLGGESFGIPIEHVREIIEFEGLVSVPLTQPHLRGVISLRGAVVPVIDLQILFGRGETAVGRRTCVVIVEVDGRDSRPLGILVDSVSEVLTVDPSKLERRPGARVGVRADFVAGIINLGDRLVVALDAKKVLSQEEMDALESAVAA